MGVSSLAFARYFLKRGLNRPISLKGIGLNPIFHTGEFGGIKNPEEGEPRLVLSDVTKLFSILKIYWSANSVISIHGPKQALLMMEFPSGGTPLKSLPTIGRSPGLP